MANNIRIKFIRGEKVKYISHLDLMKVFERALRRSRLPLAYSQGFNPHPHMVFALPLSVGVTSMAEYADLDFSEEVDPEYLVESLNKQMPEDLKVVEAKNRYTKDNIMATVSGASYEVLIAVTGKDAENEAGDFIAEKIIQLEGMDKIPVDKETKSGKKEIDIKPMIYSLRAENNCSYFDLSRYEKDINIFGPAYDKKDIACITMLLSAGSAANLKPDLVVEALKKLSAPDIRLLGIHRTALFTGKGGKMDNPMDDKVLMGG